MTALCTLVILCFSFYMRELAIKVDEKDTSPEDYSVLVKNIPIEIVKAANSEKSSVDDVNIETELIKFF